MNDYNIYCPEHRHQATPQEIINQYDIHDFIGSDSSDISESNQSHENTSVINDLDMLIDDDNVSMKSEKIV